MMKCPVCHEPIDMRLIKKGKTAIVKGACGCTDRGEFSKFVEKSKA